jgi:hypothetical protein
VNNNQRRTYTAIDRLRQMGDAEKYRLALSVANRHCVFKEALAAHRRKYSTREFLLFAEAVRLYVERTRSPGSDLQHRYARKRVI